MKFVVLLLSALTLLTACEKGPGVSAESSQNAERGAKSDLARERSLSTKSDVKATVSTPATAEIVRTARMVAPLLGTPRDPNFRHILINSQADPFQRFLPKYSTPAMVGADLTEAKRLASQDDPQASWFAAKAKCLETVKDAASFAICAPTWAYPAIAASLLLSSHEPLLGWEIDPVSSNGPKAEKKLLEYVRTNAKIAEFGNLIESELSAKVSGQALRDPDDASRRIIEALLAMDPAQLAGAWQQATAIVDQEFAANHGIDMTGAAGVHFALGSRNYQGDAQGWKITVAGAKWFGEGHAGGKKYELALESAISNSMTKKATTVDDTSQKTGTSNKANAGVGG